MSIMMLSALEALYLTRKTTLAAERLNVAQPSMSVYLKQLREATGDPLFVRTSHGLEPTDFCHGYYTRAKEILDRMELLAASKNTAFDPAKMDASFAVAIPFLKGRMLFEELSVGLTRKYPRLKIDMISLAEKQALRHLDEGTADIYIGMETGKLDKHFTTQKVLRTDLVVVCSDKSPYFKKGRIGKKEYLETPHIKASASFDASALDVEFRRKGLLQERLVSVPDVWAEIVMLQETDYLLVMDSSDVGFVKQGHNFKILKTDFDLPQFDLYAVWHARKTDDPAHKWYRARIAELKGKYA
ncbi:MAG: LysR family transcriptional regulator [Alphaproteobacteria bacterium]